MSASVGNALLPVGAPSMLCWAHSALIGQQLSASHVFSALQILFLNNFVEISPENRVLKVPK